MARTQIILEPGKADRQYWFDLWTFRELMIQLARRDISVHYKQTIIGGLWAIIRPLSAVLIFTVVFNRVAKIQADGNVNYTLFVLAGMIVWQLFATILSESSNSLVNNANLVSKVYFPRMLVPFSTIGVAIVDFIVIIPFVIGWMIYTKTVPGIQILLFPLFVLFSCISAIGFGLFLCALNVKFRDVRYIIPFVIQFGIYLSPVGFPTSRAPAELQWLFHLNPMVFAIDGMRWCLLDVGQPFQGGYWIVSVLVVMLMLTCGIYYFRKTERLFADVI